MSVVTYQRSVSLHAAQAQRVGQADHPVPDRHLVGVPAPQERRPGALDDRRAVPLDEAVDRGAVEGLAVEQPVDRQLGRPSATAHGRPPAGRPCRRRSAPEHPRARTRRPRSRPGCRRRAAGRSAGANRRTSTFAWTGSSRRRRRRACGIATTSRTRPSPRSQTSAPCDALRAAVVVEHDPLGQRHRPGRPGDDGQLGRRARRRTAAGSAAGCRRGRRRSPRRPRRASSSATSCRWRAIGSLLSGGAAASSSPYSWSTVAQVPVVDVARTARRASAKRGVGDVVAARAGGATAYTLSSARWSRSE